MNTTLLRTSGRIPSIDVMRGLIMVLMTLDHVRSNFSYSAASVLGAASPLPVNPTDLDLSTPFFFWMRWITHCCAPGFLFLAGIGIFFWQKRYGSEQSVTRYLVLRGLFIILLEAVVHPLPLIKLYGYFWLQVLWAIGASMILLALVLRFPKILLWFFSIGILLCYNLLNGVNLPLYPFDTLLKLFVTANSNVAHLFAPSGLRIGVLYPVLPWFSVMLVGYLSGDLFAMRDSARRRKILYAAGGACIILFMILRFINGYGNPQPWQHYEIFWKTIASFFNLTKYPPSLLFMLVTLGIVCICLALVEKFSIQPKLLLTLGRAPLVFYVAHLYWITAFTFILRKLSHGSLSEVTRMSFSSLGILIFTLLTVGILYPLCLLFIRYKSRNKKKLPESAGGLAS